MLNSIWPRLRKTVRVFIGAASASLAPWIVAACSVDSIGINSPSAAAVTKVGADPVDVIAGHSFSDSIRVQVTDGSGNPMSGVAVAFAVVAGGGTISPPLVITNNQGRAAAVFTTGMVPGTNTGTATVAGLPPISFNVVTIAPAGQPLSQWATGATASTQYTTTEWSAMQATGEANARTCSDDARAWASLDANGIDWLELTYAQPVRPTQIQVFENWGASSIVKIEVKNEAGVYETVFTSQPQKHLCPRVLIIPVDGITSKISVVRISVDQRTLNDWNEIDAVSLTGDR